MAGQNTRKRLLSDSGVSGWRSRRRRNIFPDPILHVRERSQTTMRAPVLSGVDVDALVESALRQPQRQPQPLEEPMIDDLLPELTP